MAELDEIIAIEINNFRVGSGRGEKSFSFLFIFFLQKIRRQTSDFCHDTDEIKYARISPWIFFLAHVVNCSAWNHLFCHNICFVWKDISPYKKKENKNQFKHFNRF